MTSIPHGGAMPCKYDFSANISPLGMHPAAQTALASLAVRPADLARYPDSLCGELRALLARFWSAPQGIGGAGHGGAFPAKNVVCGAGAADVLFSLVQAFAGAHKKIVVVAPAFTEYARAASLSGCAVEHLALSLEHDFALTDADLLRLKPMLSCADMLFVASPANPTGVVVPSDMLVRLSALCEQNSVLFVLDACFAQFSAVAEAGVHALVSRWHDFPHTVIVNAFTKFYGMAGVRLGYALCLSEAVASRLSAGMRPWAVSADAQTLGIAVLRAELAEKYPQKNEVLKNTQSEWEKRTRNLVLSERERLTAFLKSLEVSVVPSDANFILFRADDTTLSETLLSCGIAIRSGADFYGLDAHWYRIAVRSPEENTRLINALSSPPPSATRPKSRPQPAIVMLQGTMSNAGKSLLVAALCRIFRQDGYRVAPFKSQNMALNSGVTADGLEMGRAQIMQAEAAGVLPDVRMNPVLLKPTGETGSQVIVNGVPQGVMSARDYFSYRASLVPQIMDAFHSLAEENDIIVIEGAGSPAEINLKKDDIVNMGLAEMTDAPVLLVGDIDRGGVFASLYGTVALLEPYERERVKGFVINKFRGDVSLLQGGLDQIRDLTNIPVLGVVPFMPDLLIDDEDSLSEQVATKPKQDAVLHIGVVRLPYLSNFTDLLSFSRLDFVQVSFFDSLDSYAEAVTEAGEMDMFVLPGTKNTVHALSWLYETRLDKLIVRKAKSGVPVVGICGGFQLLGTALHDADGNEDESAQKTIPALGLLPTETTFTKEKTRTQVAEKLPDIQGTFSALSGCAVRGYEIHHGTTATANAPAGDAPRTLPLVVTGKNVLGTYVHGFFDSDDICRAFLSLLCARKGIPVPPYQPYQTAREAAYDRLAATVRKSLDMKKIYEIVFNR